MRDPNVRQNVKPAPNSKTELRRGNIKPGQAPESHVTDPTPEHPEQLSLEDMLFDDNQPVLDQHEIKTDNG